MSSDATDIQLWKGKSESLTDTVTPLPVRALAALLDRDVSYHAGDELPAPAHWLYFLQAAPQSKLDIDGHIRRGGFLPPIELPRRMWASSQIAFHESLRVGDAISRTSRIDDISAKQGRTGKLVFVRVRHEVHAGGKLALVEEQNLVYRDMPQANSAASPSPAPQDPAWIREIRADPVLLFRYSALTFNSHRIHYDRPYAIETEHYPGLVVHGPLIATLLLDLLYRSVPRARIREFSFRAVAPLFDIERFFVCGRPDEQNERSVRLWARDDRGGLAMEASALLE